MKPYEFHQRDVTGKVFLQMFLHHGVSAILDDDGLSVKPADIGKGLNQYVSNSGGHWSLDVPWVCCVSCVSCVQTPRTQ